MNASYIRRYQPLGIRTSYAGTPGTPGATQGNDPVLGPPFAPIDYQAFVDALSASDYVNPSVPVHLHWTVPSLTEFAYSFLDAGLETSEQPTIWYSNTDGNPSSAISLGVWDTDTGFLNSPPSPPLSWIPALKYVWATDGPAPTNPGVNLNSGSTFLGVFTWNGGTNPGTFITNYLWSSAPSDSIANFILSRSTDGTTWTQLSNSISGSALTYDDTFTRNATTNYFYQLFGVTANGLHFPYNNPGLIHAYGLVVARPAAAPATLVTWQAPDLTQFPQ